MSAAGVFERRPDEILEFAGSFRHGKRRRRKPDCGPRCAGGQD
jgi:hypothetical protein